MSDLGTVLETARRARGFTQVELAARAGTTQPSIQRYENNLREPDAETLERIATALGVTVSFLTHASRPEGAMAVQAHMRRRSTAPATTWRRLEAELNMTRWHIARLYEQVSLKATAAVPQFDPEHYSPADAARLVRTQWRLPLGPVRNLTSWLESAGILVLEYDFGSPKVDGLSQWSGDHPIIVLNSQVPTDRKRLTLAHELGHIVLHNGYAGDDMEQQANEFAAEFLMPEDVIKPSLRSMKPSQIIDLKRVWGVSMAALVERAYQLDLMTKLQRTSFYKMLNARGWRFSEPASDELAPETPELARMIGDEMLAAGLSVEDVAHILGFEGPEDNYIVPTPKPRLRAV
ncbi:helix-turn-helix domain-containing protein [Arthrobacter woluwensis]|uniref:helix-turn-helix domain-containing protein n=1 Tax=Arthrobacter woluwensis TaxID=156980 RepID=UPI003819EA0F